MQTTAAETRMAEEELPPSPPGGEPAVAMETEEAVKVEAAMPPVDAAPHAASEHPPSDEAAQAEAAALATAAASDDAFDTKVWEEVLRHNSSNQTALSRLADIARMQGRHLEAAGHLTRLLQVGMPPTEGESSSSGEEEGGPMTTGEVQAALGHCFLAVSYQEGDLPGVLKRLQDAYDAYKQALAKTSGEDSDLWYGIGLLYDRYASLMMPCAQRTECEGAACKAFDAVLTIEPEHERRDEVLFRLGLLLKAQSNRKRALECFTAISERPSRPVDALDVWFQARRCRRAPPSTRGAHRLCRPRTTAASPPLTRTNNGLRDLQA